MLLIFFSLSLVRLIVCTCFSSLFVIWLWCVFLDVSSTDVAEGRYIKGDPLKGYYDFIITEGSYKFWAGFQVRLLSTVKQTHNSAPYYLQSTIYLLFQLELRISNKKKHQQIFSRFLLFIQLFHI